MRAVSATEMCVVTSVLLEAALFSPNTAHVCNKKEYAPHAYA